MEIDTPRSKAIKVWIDDHPEEKSKYEKAPVELNGKTKYLDVWNIPIKLLIYNIRNGRFAAELLAKEKELKRKLDPTDAKDAKVIQKILLEQKPVEAEALKADIKEHGQMQYGIITFDGAVINANRRMAVISKLFDETHTRKFEFLRVAILPPNVNEMDLWRIEAGIQFGKDFILDYGPVNELLKLREGTRLNLSPEDIETTLLGQYTKKQIEEKLEILKQIESYLEFIGKPQEYDLLKGDVEKFNSLQKNVIASLKKQGVSAEEIHKINLVGFLLIKSSLNPNASDTITHWDIRKLKDISHYERSKNELLSKYDVNNPEKTNLNELIESFTNAKEIEESQKNQDKPKKLLRKALEAIEAINEGNPKLNETEVSSLLDQIISAVEKLKKKE